MSTPKDSSNVEQNQIPQIDLSIFKEHMNETFLDKLHSLPDMEKLIFLAKPCLPQLNYITKFDKVQKRKVKKIEILSENLSESFESTPLIIYIIPPELNYLKTIENHLSKTKNKMKKQFHIIFIPQITNECLSFINSSTFKLYVKFDNLNIDMYYLDRDLLSLEDHFAFYNLYVKDDLNILSILSKCIIKYEAIFGKIKYKYYKGSSAKKLNQLILNEEETLSLENNNNLETLGCIILDRNVDMITPFCSNFIYEGLIDEYFGINFNSIKISSKILEKEKDETLKIDLSENDKFYTKIKDYNFAKIRTFLPNRLKEHSKILEEGKKKMEDMKKIQENLEKVKIIKDERNSLTTNINLADYIAQKQKEPSAKNYLVMEQSILAGDLSYEKFEFIDNELTKKSEEYNLLKILCLISSLKNGIKNKIYEQIKREFLQIYGFQELFLWNNLEKVNALKSQDGSSYFNDIDKKLKLIYEDVNLNEPNDISYSYSGYAPISIRLVEKAITKGWKSIEDVLYKLPGGEYYYPKDESEMVKETNDIKYFLLVFIGGITYGELSAIRYLNKKFKNKKFVILTTGMINYKKLFNSLKRGRYNYIPDEISNLNGDSLDNKLMFKNVLSFDKVNEEINK
jgi:hypothetical protein